MTTISRKLLEKRSNWLKQGESRRKRREKCRDSESFKRRPRTDRLKLMLLEQRELSKRVSALLEIRREKNLSTSRRSLKTWSKPDSNSSSIESADLLNKPSKKETSS